LTFNTDNSYARFHDLLTLEKISKLTYGKHMGAMPGNMSNDMSSSKPYRIRNVKKKEEFFMELRDYIEQGAKKAGSLTALGLMLGMSQPNISNVKAHKKPLPVKAVVELAEYIGEDLKAVIAANELVTEKDEKKRAFWSPFVEHARAAGVMLGIALVTSFVTPSPAEASQYVMTGGNDLYYVKSRRTTSLKKWQLKRLIERLMKALFPTLKRRILQP
jgi:hypothetical protein